VNDGGGGNITIDPEVVILQNGSLIEARAGDGTGGTIAITADNYFAFPGTVVSADADDPDLSGTVEVNTPDVNLAGALAELPSNPLDAASQMKEPCAARRSGERAGSFAVRAAEGIPPEPDGWLPATVGAGGGAVPAARGELGTAGSTLLTAAVCR
jgi:large exoprotein involved in heme utilization and adhesion